MWSFARRRVLPLYLAAVVGSCAYQTARPGVPVPSSDQQREPLPRFGANGPLPGPPVDLAYQDKGTGPVVVLLHGSPGAVADFRHLLPHLTDRFRVLVPDLPGFGGSGRWLPDYSVAAHARYVLAWLDRLGVTEFQVVGFSMGSGVALHIADLAPDRVRSVTLYGGIGIQEGEGSGDYHLEHAKYALLVPTVVALPELVPHFGALGTRSFRWTFFRNFWDTDQRPLRAVVERLRPPLLVLHGRQDALVPAWVAVAHHELHPDGELHLFPDSHFMLFSAEKTDRLAAALVPFLERHRGPGPAIAQSHVVWYNEMGTPAAPPELPRRRMWPAGAQVGAAFAAALVLPVPGCVLTGVLVVGDRIDPFAGWLGCLLGGLVRRAARGPGSGWALARWPLLAGGVVVGVSGVGAAVGWWAVVAVCGAVALGRAVRARNRGPSPASNTGPGRPPGPHEPGGPTMTTSLRAGAAALALLAGIGCGATANQPKAGAPERGPKVGGEAKDFELTAIGGEPVKLSKLTDKGPVVLVVLRGYPGYQCPLCTRQVGELLGQADAFKKAGAQVVLVYPGPADKLKEKAGEFVKGKDYPTHFTLVLDPDYTFTNSYGLRWDAKNETAYPSTFVIGRDRKVSFAKVSSTHGDRSKVDDVLKAVGAK